MIDLSRLEEALRWWENAVYMELTEAEEDHVRELVAAVRVLLAGTPIQWCEAHSSSGPTDSEGAGHCWFIMFAELIPKAYPDWHPSQYANHGPCKMSARLVLLKGDST